MKEHLSFLILKTDKNGMQVFLNQMQTICKCMLFDGLYSIQIEQAACFLRTTFCLGLLWCTGERLQRISCGFPLTPSLKGTKACTKETGNPGTQVFCLTIFLSPTVSNPQTHFHVCTYLCACHLLGCKKSNSRRFLSEE